MLDTPTSTIDWQHSVDADRAAPTRHYCDTLRVGCIHAASPTAVPDSVQRAGSFVVEVGDELRRPEWTPVQRASGS